MRLGIADEGIPPDRSVELDVGLDVLLLARNPRKNDDDSIHPLDFLSPPIKPTAISPHLRKQAKSTNLGAFSAPESPIAAKTSIFRNSNPQNPGFSVERGNVRKITLLGFDD